MTAIDVVFRYNQPPSASNLRAIQGVREVYGVRRIQFNEAERTIRVEYDASRLTDSNIAGLLRRTGMDLGEKLSLV